MFHRILLAADPEGNAEAVIPALVGLAAGDAEVMVISVASPAAGVPAASRAAELAAVAIGDRGLTVSTRVRRTHLRGIARAITAVAEEFGPDLVCMGSHGRTPLVSLVLGSVTHSVTARVDCPVLVSCPLAPISPHRVLLAISDDPQSAEAVATTLEMAEGMQLEVLVVNVLELAMDSEPRGEGPHARAHAMVDEAVGLLGDAGIPATAWLVPGSGGGVYGEIADAGKEWPADLIIVGSRRLPDLRALLLGSVSNNVARSASTPVLVGRRTPRQARRVSQPTGAGRRAEGAA